uniref:Uncharacterized protein n=1 Tax=Romanomermis culicivorax TaxID=13658 RepID=A0A915KBP0_ROMCU
MNIYRGEVANGNSKSGATTLYLLVQMTTCNVLYHEQKNYMTRTEKERKHRQKMHVGHPVDGKLHREIAVQIDKLDDQPRGHLHRKPTDCWEGRAKGSGAGLLTASSGRPVKGS